MQGAKPTLTDSVPTLKALAERGIEIGFDTYAPIAADEEQQTAQG